VIYRIFLKFITYDYKSEMFLGNFYFNVYYYCFIIGMNIYGVENKLFCYW